MKFPLFDRARMDAYAMHLLRKNMLLFIIILNLKKLLINQRLN
jgi:hypothetical protein